MPFYIRPGVADLNIANTFQGKCYCSVHSSCFYIGFKQEINSRVDATNYRFDSRQKKCAWTGRAEVSVCVCLRYYESLSPTRLSSSVTLEHLQTHSAALCLLSGAPKAGIKRARRSFMFISLVYNCCLWELERSL